jgi:hypothetical protein
MKGILHEWGYNKACICDVSDASPMTLSVAGEEVMTAKVVDHSLTLKWPNGE